MAFQPNRRLYCPRKIAIETQSSTKTKMFWMGGPNGLWKHVCSTNFTNNIAAKNQSLTISPQAQFERTKFYTKMNAGYAKQMHKKLSGTITNIMRASAGLNSGFHKVLRLRGVGFKFVLEKNILKITVGYSHELVCTLPSDIKVKFSRKGRVARFYSQNLQELRGLLSYLRSLSKPDVYKGKGIRYRRDSVIRKEGKKKRAF